MRDVMALEQRSLGSTGESVSLVGLGGNRLLTRNGGRDESCRLVKRALDLGVDFFDTARLYRNSEVYLGGALRGRRHEIFLASKSHARDRKGASAQLGETLRRLRTDYLDLWQLHDLRTEEDVHRIFRSGGAIEAFVEARSRGWVRYLGVTGHRNAEVIRQCLECFDFDTVMIPVNAAERHHGSFLESVLPLAKRAGVGVIGIYAFCGGGVADLSWVQTVEPFLRFSLTQSVSTVLVGCDSVRQLDESIGYASRFAPMTPSEVDALVLRTAPHATRLMYYKFPRQTASTEMAS